MGLCSPRNAASCSLRTHIGKSSMVTRSSTYPLEFSKLQLAKFQGTSVVHSHGFYLKQKTFQTRSFHGVTSSTLAVQTRMGRISDGLPFFLRTGSQMTDHPLSNTVRQGSSETRHRISGTCTPKRVQPSPFSCSSYLENFIITNSPSFREKNFYHGRHRYLRAIVHNDVTPLNFLFTPQSHCLRSRERNHRLQPLSQNKHSQRWCRIQPDSRLR